MPSGSSEGSSRGTHAPKKTTVYLNTLNRDNWASTDPFDCYVSLPSPLSGVESIEILSVTLTQGWANTRSPYNTYSYSDSLGSHTVTVTTASKSASDLCTELTNLTADTFAYDSNTGKVTVTTGDSLYTVTKSTTNYVAIFLGIYGGSGSSFTGSSVCNLNHDNEVFISFPQIPGAVSSRIPCHVATPAPGLGVISYNHCAAVYRNVFRLNGHDLPGLRIKVYDVHGNAVVNGLNNDLTLVLEVVTL